MNETSNSEERSFGTFQLVALVLSVFALFTLALDTAVDLPPDASHIVHVFDNIVCAVFFIDFVIQFRRAENKAAYMKVGWIDLLASVPVIDALRWGRLARVFRVLRVLRAIRGTQKLYRLLKSNQLIGASLGLLALMVVVTGSITILIVEQGDQVNIKSAVDALWWTVTTITTVGYGDLYPVTPEGRFVATLVMVAGVGVFGSFTAYLASMLTLGKDEEQTENELLREVRALRTEVESLRASMTAKDS